MFKTIFLLASLGLFTMIPHLSANEATPNKEINVSISHGLKNTYVLNGQFSISASTNAAWETLTDYANMADFVSNVQSSKIIHSERNTSQIEQVMIGYAGIFHKRINLVLDVNETPGEKIEFIDISKKSFKFYKGEWAMEDSNGEILITYNLEATPSFFSPDFIAQGSFKKNVALLLEEVRAEISKRDNTSASASE